MPSFLKLKNKEGRRPATEESGGTIVSELAMRLARYSASDTYYPQTLSVLRLDRPRLTSADDDISSLLYRILPQSRRPDATLSPADAIKALTERLKAAQGDQGETARLLQRIGEIATGKNPAPSFAPAGLLDSISPDLEKGIKESLAFRSTVTTVPASEKAQMDGGTSASEPCRSRRAKVSMRVYSCPWSQSASSIGLCSTASTCLARIFRR
jgi:hypothetical protein